MERGRGRGYGCLGYRCFSCDVMRKWTCGRAGAIFRTRTLTVRPWKKTAGEMLALLRLSVPKAIPVMPLLSDTKLDQLKRPESHKQKGDSDLDSRAECLWII